jgi:hypothetical protein
MPLTSIAFLVLVAVSLLVFAVTLAYADSQTNGRL